MCKSERCDIARGIVAVAVGVAVWVVVGVVVGVVVWVVVVMDAARLPAAIAGLFRGLI